MVALVLAPHTDDGEMGCGGYMVRLLDEGSTVYYAAFSCAEKSVPVGWSPTVLRDEVARATTVLGVAATHLYVYDQEVRMFPARRQEILDTLIQLREELHPSLVILPSRMDGHQDHQVVSEEGVRAFKHCSVLGYEQPWNNVQMQTDFFVPLTREQLDRKIGAIACYESQKHRPYAKPSFFESLATVRGVQVGVNYAEAYEVIRWVL